MKGVKAKWGWMREAEFRSLVRGVAPTVIRDSDPPPPRLSISGDSIRGRAMQVALMSHRTTAPQIEALEPECWGVSWGVGLH